MKTFKYKKYKKCFFIVSSYVADEDAMYIGIENETEGSIADCTVYYKDGIYIPGFITVKNYSENSNLTNFLKELKIITEICTRFPCNNFPETLATLNGANPQSIDYCQIDIEKLKEYSKEWHYQNA